MTERYIQKVEVAVSKTARRDQIIGLVFQLLGLGLIPISILYSYWVFFGVGALIGVGIWFTQRFYSSAKEYEYAFTGTRLIISRTNLLGKGRRVTEIALGDVRTFTRFYDTVTPRDILAAESAGHSDIKAMTFLSAGEEHRLLFAPDEYMAILIGDALRAGASEKSKEKV